MNAENLREQLLDKATEEQARYIEELKQLPPEKIIEKAYEKVMRDDIVIAFEYAMLSDAQLMALANAKYPVSACFDEWQKRDVTYMDRIMEAVDKCSENLAVEAEVKKRSEKNKREPER